MTTIYPTLYSASSKNQKIYWWMERDGARYRSLAKTGKDGKTRESGWIVAEAKNMGRSNQTDPEDQALLEVDAKYTKKLKNHWWKDPADWDKKHYLEPMLAHKYDKSPEDIVKLWTKEDQVYVQPKLDGIRCILNKDGAFTRKGERIHAIPHIIEGAKQFFDENPFAVLDGELYNHDYHDKFEELTSIIRREHLTDDQVKRSEEVVQYHIYDLPSNPKMNYISRFNRLSEITQILPIKYFRFVETSLAFHSMEVEQALTANLALDYEGIMIRLDKPYDIGRRSKSLLKYKKFTDGEFEIVSIEDGSGHWAGHAKRVVIKLEDGTTCEAGIKGNFTFTRNLFKKRKEMIGNDVTIRYFERTSDNKLRFGVAVDFHDGKRKS